MSSHPTKDELLAAVSDFIMQIAPQLKDRDAFLARVATNSLAIVRREFAEGSSAEAAARARLALLLGDEGDFPTLNTRLCAAIRAGEFDEDEAMLMRHLKASAIDQVRIDQPTYSGLKAAQIGGQSGDVTI
jgi:hypothetical protein